MKQKKPAKMDNKKLAMIIAAILILIIAFVVVRSVLVKEEEKSEKGISGAGIEEAESVEEVFEEPPTDLQPPSLPS